VAIDIADARAKSGWRTVPDDDFAPDQTAEIARLRRCLSDLVELHGGVTLTWLESQRRIDSARKTLDGKP
jgi:3',5'-cyclic AMP phosphodiesterase CpdA